MNKFLCLVVIVMSGCATPNTFNASQPFEGAGVVSNGRIGLSNKITYSVSVLADGTMSNRMRAEESFLLLEIKDAKTGVILVSVSNAQDALWQHEPMKPGATRRLNMTTVTAGFPTNVVETWECLVVGNQVVDLDDQLSAWATGNNQSLDSCEEDELTEEPLDDVVAELPAPAPVERSPGRPTNRRRGLGVDRELPSHAPRRVPAAPEPAAPIEPAPVPTAPALTPEQRLRELEAELALLRERSAPSAGPTPMRVQ